MTNYYYYSLQCKFADEKNFDDLKVGTGIN